MEGIVADANRYGMHILGIVHRKAYTNIEQNRGKATKDVLRVCSQSCPKLSGKWECDNSMRLSVLRYDVYYKKEKGKIIVVDVHILDESLETLVNALPVIRESCNSINLSDGRVSIDLQLYEGDDAKMVSRCELYLVFAYRVLEAYYGDSPDKDCIVYDDELGLMYMYRDAIRYALTAEGWEVDYEEMHISRRMYIIHWL